MEFLEKNFGLVRSSSTFISVTRIKNTNLNRLHLTMAGAELDWGAHDQQMGSNAS
jgi:hypothetical protein